MTLRGSFERTYWADAHFADGSTQYLSRDSYDDYGLTLRAAYELTPGVKPFVEGFVDQRIHDTTYGTTGYARNSDGVSVTAGSTFELTRLLVGTASAGYADRNYQDPRLANLRGPVFDISLVWTATPLTKVTLRDADHDGRDHGRRRLGHDQPQRDAGSGARAAARSHDHRHGWNPG